MKNSGPIALLILTTMSTTGCREVGPEQFGAQGESCLADSDCRGGDLLCIEGVCDFEAVEWPIDTPREDLTFPEGLYIAASVTFTNSNAATRTLQPFIDASMEEAGVRPSFILDIEASNAPFLMHTGPVDTAAPQLDFFPSPLDVQPLTGAAIDLGTNALTFETISTRPRVRPPEYFFLWLRGEDFDIPVPIAPSRISGSIEQGIDLEFDLVADGYIFASQATQVPVVAPGAETLAELLDPDTGDVDFDRDGTPEGWSVQMRFRAKRH